MLILRMALLILLVPALANATTFYVSNTTSNGFTSGNDGNACTALGSPCATVTGGLGKLSAGDSLVINNGTYTTEISAIISSTSYASATQMMGWNGASSAVIIKPSSGTRAMTLSNDRYIIISDIVFDGDAVISDAVKVDSASDHIRFVRTTFRNGTNQGLLISDSSFVECLTCISHTNGSTSSQHGIYIGNSDDCLIQGGEFYGNAGGGVHIASGTPQRNIIENIRSHDNLWGIVDADESGNVWRNNVVYDNTSNGGNFISLSGSEVYNNTFYGNGGAGFWSESDTTGILYKNNISYGNTGAALTLQGSGHTQTTNLATDPSFTNAATGDFTLQSGSTARDTGTDLSATGFADDVIGTARPQNGTWDIGAYEYIVGSGGSDGGHSTTPAWDTPRRSPMWRR